MPGGTHVATLANGQKLQVSAAERGLGFVPDPLRDRRHALGAAQQVTRGKLHPPVREVLNRRLSDGTP